MSPYTLLTLDVFTEEPYGGNPCAVVLDADRLSTNQMQTIAREMNLSETAFVLRSDRASWRVRYFTPRKEIPFAGHPTIAVTYALIEVDRIRLQAPSTTIDLEFEIGVLPVRVDIAGSTVTRAAMTQSPPEFGETLERRRVAPALGLSADALHPDCPPQVGGVGVRFLMIALRDRATLLDLTPAWEELASICESVDCTAAYVFAPGGSSSEVHLSARFFDPFARYEDPFTGSACGAMAALAARRGLTSEASLIVEQGESVGRPGRATVELSEAAPQLLVAGTAVCVLRGTLVAPPAGEPNPPSHGGD